MPKRISLTDALQAEEESPPSSTPPERPDKKHARSKARARDSATSKPRPDRDDRVMISGWFSPHVRFALDELRLRLSRNRGRKVTMIELQAEAYNDLFKKYGMAELAPLPPDTVDVV